MEHLAFLHLDIGKLLGSRLLTLTHTLGVGFILGGLENFSGLLGSLSVTLLRTRIFECFVLFVRYHRFVGKYLTQYRVTLYVWPVRLHDLSDFIADLAKFNR